MWRLRMHWCMAEKLQYGHLNFFLMTVNSLTGRQHRAHHQRPCPPPPRPPAEAKGSHGRSDTPASNTLHTQPQQKQHPHGAPVGLGPSPSPCGHPAVLLVRLRGIQWAQRAQGRVPTRRESEQPLPGRGLSRAPPTSPSHAAAQARVSRTPARSLPSGISPHFPGVSRPPWALGQLITTVTPS